MAADERDALYRVAYEEAVRVLAEQRVLLESLRARAGLLLSAAAISSSFLGAQALGGVLSWAALLAFLATSGTCLAMLWPQAWEEAIDVIALIEKHPKATDPAPLTRLYEGLALNMNYFHQRNQLGLERLSDLLQLAGGFLGLEIVLWIAAIAFQA